MIGRRTLGRAIFFGLGYVAGTRAGREQYARIRSAAGTLVEALRARATESGDSSTASPSRRPDPYADIRLGEP
ncbi:hypothetical protein GCM10009718_04550 [Isoptericola halotolerans]|uniref:YtxH domain-containing protein n=1 Tax=Isoptericola halotolerans TaxID=300560 RepID=A0ABX2A1Q1_9MICO|nr:hypothetical protein [Isoptericola halotolerans]NOV96621.1 hypothetical protein [Isoptericola halotolerans]